VEIDKSDSKDESLRRYYKDPRGGLYRTEKLGGCLESGDAECTGRTGDQVQIRGFRIGLNDIDSNLHQNP
jgi:non-ribosomal peptide synthetase component F